MSLTVAEIVRKLCETHNVSESSHEAKDAEAMFRFYIKHGYTMSYATEKVDAKLRRNSQRMFDQWKASVNRG